MRDEEEDMDISENNYSNTNQPEMVVNLKKNGILKLLIINFNFK